MHATALAKGSKQPQREEPEERSSPPEVLAVLTVEGAGVAACVLGTRIALGAARATAALALPAHRVALAREPKAMAEQAAAHHRLTTYPEGER
jgi:hypothetical protein